MGRFIGREDVLNNIRDGIFVKTPGAGSCHSLSGLNGIGKTRLVEKWAEDWEADTTKNSNIYYFKTDMLNVKKEWDYWSRLIQRFSKKITRDRLKSAPNPSEEHIETILSHYKKVDPFSDGFIEALYLNTPMAAVLQDTVLTELFAAYKELGIHIILTIDEFDLVADIFPPKDAASFSETGNSGGDADASSAQSDSDPSASSNTPEGPGTTDAPEKGNSSFFQRLYGLSKKGAGDNQPLTILLISRRRVGTLVHGMDAGSNFEDAYPAQSLKGFTYQEVSKYLQTLTNYPALSEDAFSDIINYCGTHPGLLTTMGELIDSVPKGQVININDLFRDNRMTIEKSFRRMHTLMKKEYISYAPKKSCVSPFKQAFLGPVYDSELSYYLETLLSYGFVLQQSHDTSIYELAGWSEEEIQEKILTTYAGNSHYEPITPYFVAYMKHRISPEELDALGGLLEETELSIRRLICQIYQEMYPNDWKDQLAAESHSEDLGNDLVKKERFYNNLDKMAVANEAESDYTFVDVLAFSEYAKILIKHWDRVKTYLQSYTIEALEDDFFYLTLTRNTVDHKNMPVLNDQYREIAATLCERVLQDLKDGWNNRNREETPKAPECHRFSNWQMLYQGSPVERSRASAAQVAATEVADANATVTQSTLTSATTAATASAGSAATLHPIADTSGSGSSQTMSWAWENDYNNLLSRSEAADEAPIFDFEREGYYSFELEDGQTEWLTKGFLVSNGKKYVATLDAHYSESHLSVQLDSTFRYKNQRGRVYTGLRVRVAE